MYHRRPDATARRLGLLVRQNRAMKPAGLHHVAICVADAQKGLAFYRDMLGMTQLPRPDLGAGYWSTLAASKST